MGIQSSPKRPRDPAQGNMVSQSARPNAPVTPESQFVTTEYLSCDPARACQSLAHHATPMGRCLKSVDTWAPQSEEPQSRSTTTNPAARLGNQGNSASQAAVLQRRLAQTTPVRAPTRVPDTSWH
eukprot:scaffold10020_cov122-Isochrysis_galbana.AAC.4